MMDKMKKVQGYLDEFRNICENEDDFIWNIELDRFKDKRNIKKVDLIIIGENPGENERMTNTYFSIMGYSGLLLRLLLDSYYKIKYNTNYVEKVMLLNKIPIFSKDIATLKENRYSNKEKYNIAETKMGEIIAGIVDNLSCNNVKTLFLGLSDGRVEYDNQKFLLKKCSDSLFANFYNAFFRHLKNEKNIYLVPHLSKRQIFNHKYLDDFSTKTDIVVTLFEQHLFKSRFIKK